MPPFFLATQNSQLAAPKWLKIIDEIESLIRYNVRMISNRESCRESSKVSQAQAEFAKLLTAAETRGFHGTASITVSVQDGHIQHLRVAVDRMIR